MRRSDDGVATIGCDDVSTILVGQTEGILVSPKQQNLSVYPDDAVCNWHIVVPADMVHAPLCHSYTMQQLPK